MAKTLRRGKYVEAEAEIEITDIRSLTRADLSVLTERRPVNQLQTLRDNHHRIARAVASGMDNYEVAALCGVSYNRVGMLKSDPAFAELTAHYRGMITAEWLRSADPVLDYMTEVQVKALAQMSEKLDEAEAEGKLLPTRELVAMAELGLDRTGYGKTNKNVNVNVSLASDLEAARRRASKAKEIEGTTVTPGPTHALDLAPTDRQPTSVRSTPATPSPLRRL